jgi:hypothetical protein
MDGEYKKDEAQSESTRSRQVRGNPMKEYRMSANKTAIRSATIYTRTMA